MTSDGLLLVNFDSLQQASADIQKALTTMQSQLDQLKYDAKSLVDTWDGEAQQAYAERQARWEAASADLHAILQGIKRAVDDSLDDYTNTERAATQRFR